MHAFYLYLQPQPSLRSDIELLFNELFLFDGVLNGLEVMNLLLVIFFLQDAISRI